MKITDILRTLRAPSLAVFMMALPMWLMAQRDSDSIRINADFLKELDGALGFRNERPLVSPINTIEAVRPDTELLHQWVKDPRSKTIATVSTIPMKVNIPGLTDGGFAKGVVAWRSKSHPDMMLLNTGQGYVASGLDVNGFLTKYLTKEGRTLRRSRDLAASCKDIMDRFFPINGSAIFSKDDSLALGNKNKK